MKEAAFDKVANAYDGEFSHTAIGYLQRKEVWDYLHQLFEKQEGETLKIVEVNCGTGEDAIFLGKRGHRVLATDISSGMVQVTSQKIAENGLVEQVSAQVLSIQELGTLKGQQFDLLFSNFGGLNCLSKEELKELAQVLPTLLRPNGRLIGVIMSSFCVWESLYFLAKRDVKNAFRRRKKEGVVANLGASEIHTWYYSPQTFARFFSNTFQLETIKPIGIAIPPSYLNPLVVKRAWLLKGVKKWEKRLNRFQGLGAWSDHYLIDLVLKK